jgi:hypothetical protein
MPPPAGCRKSGGRAWSLAARAGSLGIHETFTVGRGRSICDQQDVGSAGFDMDVKKPATIRRYADTGCPGRYGASPIILIGGYYVIVHFNILSKKMN